MDSDQIVFKAWSSVRLNKPGPSMFVQSIYCIYSCVTVYLWQHYWFEPGDVYFAVDDINMTHVCWSEGKWEGSWLWGSLRAQRSWSGYSSAIHIISWIRRSPLMGCAGGESGNEVGFVLVHLPPGPKRSVLPSDCSGLTPQRSSVFWILLKVSFYTL